jgi:beta-glucosidase
VSYIAGPTFEAQDISSVDMVAVINAANAAELVVICVGEDTYTEKPGDIDDLMLSAGQVEVYAVPK